MKELLTDLRDELMCWGEEIAYQIEENRHYADPEPLELWQGDMQRVNALIARINQALGECSE